MRVFHLTGAVAALATALSVSVAAAQSPQIPEVPTCFSYGLTQWKRVQILGYPLYAAPLAVIVDGAMNDFGRTSTGDSLELYCVFRQEGSLYGSIAVCLSGESCLYR
jgi:hypothetical protein